MKDAATISKLKTVAQNDEYYGVRERAASSLRKIHTDEALDALIACCQQSDARVRRTIVEEIGKFYHPRAMDTLLRCLENERNPAIIVAALKGLASYHQTSIHAVLLKYLNMPSYNNCIAIGAIEAIKAQDDPGFVSDLTEALKKHESEFRSNIISETLNALAYIERNEKNRDEVRNFICSYLNNKREEVQLGAMRALGTLEDGKSIPILETFASALKDTTQQETAQQAINQLRWSNKPNDNLRDLRNEVLELKNTTRDQQKAINDLKQLLEAKQTKKISLEKKEKASKKEAGGDKVPPDPAKSVPTDPKPKEGT